MTKKVIKAHETDSIVFCSQLMRKNNIGFLPILNKCDEVIGVITDRDIVLRGVSCDKNAKTTPISEIMTTNIYCCTPNDDIYDAECKMSQNQVRRMR